VGVGGAAGGRGGAARRGPRQSSNALTHASAELQGDQEVVLTAVGQNCVALYHTSAEMQANRKFVYVVLAALATRCRYGSLNSWQSADQIL
jgi:hypothetical protein